MQKHLINIEFEQYDLNELPDDLRSLANEARRASLSSYAPYSHFHVGAAILMADGSVHKGSNQENAAYPSGICAERNATWHAAAALPGVAMKAIAVAAWTRAGMPEDTPPQECWQESPISPCGACRQSMLEYETLHGDIKVLLLGRSTAYLFPSVKSMLPFSFTEF